MILARQKLQQVSPTSGKLWMIPSALSHNAGIITALIGSTTYSCTLSGLVANTRYQLYVVPGSTTLQFSTRENSLGPLGFTSWILIGSFYTNNLSPVSLGGFVKIDATPESEWFSLNNTVGVWLVGSTSNPTYGTVVSNILRGRRVGEKFFVEWDYRHDAAGVAGSGQYLLNCQHPVDLTKYKPNNSISFLGHIGRLTQIELSAGNYDGVNQAYLPAGTTNQIGVLIAAVGPANTTLNSDWSSGVFHMNVANIIMSGRFEWFVTGWTNTPLKDL